MINKKNLATLRRYIGFLQMALLNPSNYQYYHLESLCINTFLTGIPYDSRETCFYILCSTSTYLGLSYWNPTRIKFKYSPYPNLNIGDWRKLYYNVIYQRMFCIQCENWSFNYIIFWDFIVDYKITVKALSKYHMCIKYNTCSETHEGSK